MTDSSNNREQMVDKQANLKASFTAEHADNVENGGNMFRTMNHDIGTETMPPQQSVQNRETVPPQPQSPLPHNNNHWNIGQLILERYQVVELLGQGGMGVVYRCKDTVSDVDVAVKALPPEVSHSTAEMEEVRENYNLVSKLVHASIAAYKTLEMDKATGNYYLVLEYVGGEDLRHWMKRLRRDGKMSLETVLPVLRQIAEALDFAHGKDVIHRDVKPDNVKITADGAVKLLDFGLAAQIRTSQAHVSKEDVARAGTPLYKSPEQWGAKSRQGASTDQYSLAVVAYEMLAGHVPFESDDRDLLKAAVLKDDPEPIEGLPKYVNSVLKKGLAKEASGRYATCVDFVRALGGEKVRGSKKKDKRKWLVVAAVGMLLGLAGIGILYALKGGNDNNPIALEPPVAGEVTPPESDIETPGNTGMEPPSPESPSAQLEKTAAIDDEYYQLKGHLKEYNDNVFSKYKKELDRAQTFGKHMDDFEKNYQGGVGASGDNDHKAYDFFKKAEDARGWLEKNIPLRKEAAKARQTAEGKKQEADGEKAKEYATEDYKKAESLFKNGVSEFDKGEFQIALNNFSEAIKKWNIAIDNAKEKRINQLEQTIDNAFMNGNWDNIETRINELRELGETQKASIWDKQLKETRKRKEKEENLSAAKEAKIQKKWQLAYDKACYVLELEPDNIEAKTIKADVWKNLHPIVKFKAIVDGRMVNAFFKVNDGSQVYRTQEAYFDWEKGRSYKLSFWYENEMNRWEINMSVIPDKDGESIYDIPLKKVSKDIIFQLSNGISLKMKQIPAGSFTVRLIGEDDIFMLHNSYWLGETEVTQAQWNAIGTKRQHMLMWKGDDLPIVNVSWKEARQFCDDLNRFCSDKLPKGYHFDLPTEAQWEHAARGGKNERYIYSGGDNLDDVGWYYENSGQERLDEKHFDALKIRPNGNKPHPVRSKKNGANSLGLYDMSGNVDEWCRDWYTVKRSHSPETLEDLKEDWSCVVRGGSWNGSSVGCRLWHREHNPSTWAADNLGFRVALVPVQ